MHDSIFESIFVLAAHDGVHEEFGHHSMVGVKLEVADLLELAQNLIFGVVSTSPRQHLKPNIKH